MSFHRHCEARLRAEAIQDPRVQRFWVMDPGSRPGRHRENVDAPLLSNPPQKPAESPTTIRYNHRVPNYPTILVFDSGLGGLSVLREVVRARPDAHYVYVADDAFFPYGHHSEEALVDRVVPLMGELIAAHRPDLIVIACNTASVQVLAPLRAAYATPFVGTVPAIKPACAQSTTRRVSVLGTKATVAREYTRALIRDFGEGCEVTLVGSPELASLAERALSGEAATDSDIAAEIAPCFVGAADDATMRTDTVVLACTHFPLLLDRLQRLAPWPVEWIDPAPAIARRVADLLGPPGAEADQAGATMIFTSNKPHTLSRALTPYFGGRVPA
jgi:glutamate racemase